MLVAYSGGVDSTLLAAVARDVLGEKTRCVLLDSPVVPRAAVRQAQAVARELGLGLEIIVVPLMRTREFRKNPPTAVITARRSRQFISESGLQNSGLPASPTALMSRIRGSTARVSGHRRRRGSSTRSSRPGSPSRRSGTLPGNWAFRSGRSLPLPVFHPASRTGMR